MLTRIHVNQHNIKHNQKAAGFDQMPVLTVKDYKGNRKGNTAKIMMNGTVMAEVVYRPDNPLPCGARCWVETKLPVKVE